MIVWTNSIPMYAVIVYILFFIKLMVQVGNEVSNKFWQYKIPDDDKISPESSRCVYNHR